MKIRVYENLTDVEPIWRELFADCAYRTPFLSFEWANCWWKHFSGFYKKHDMSAALRITVVFNSRGQAVGLAPFHRVSFRHGLTELRLLGDLGDCEGLTEVPIIIFRQGWEEKVNVALFGHLRKFAYPADCDVIKMRWQSYNAGPSQTRRLFHRNFTEPGRQVLLLPNSWEKFRGLLSQTTRKNLKYYPNRLTKKNLPWEIKTLRKPEEGKLAIELLVKLHILRSKSQHGPRHLNHFSGKYQLEFLRDILTEMMERQEVVFWVLMVADQPVGIQCVLLNDQELIFYYSGFDGEWYDYSPLTIISAAIIKDAIAEDFKRINFLFARAMWKQRWGAENETYLHMDYAVRLTLASVLHVSQLWAIKKVLAPFPAERGQWRELMEELSSA